VENIRREAHSRTFAHVPSKRADPTNTLLQVLEAAGTEEAKGYIDEINAIN
jgi:hypothetical protein